MVVGGTCRIPKWKSKRYDGQAAIEDAENPDAEQVVNGDVHDFVLASWVDDGLDCRSQRNDDGMIGKQEVIKVNCTCCCPTSCREKVAVAAVKAVKCEASNIHCQIVEVHSFDAGISKPHTSSVCS